MSATTIVPAEYQRRILESAVREERRVVLTHHGSSGWRLYKGTFGGSGSDRSMTVVLPAALLSEPVQLQKGDLLGCAFRDGHRKCICTSLVEQIRDSGDAVSVQLKRPEQVQQLQRRAYERAVPPATTVVAVRFWKDAGKGSNAEGGRQVRHGQLVDISAGGMSVKVGDWSEVEVNSVYGCGFTTGPGKPAYVLDALLRHCQPEDQNRAVLGFQFIGLETTPEGCRTLDRLARLVARYQRGRQRRKTSRE